MRAELVYAPEYFAVGDFDGDGFSDVVASMPTWDSLAFERGDGHGRLTYVSTIPIGDDAMALAPCDFDADGKLDVACLQPSVQRLSIYLGDGAGGFSPGASTPVGMLGSSARNLELADVDRDGLQDFVIAAGAAVVVVKGGLGGTFGAMTNSPITSATMLALGDFDEDGNLDVVTANRYFSPLYLAFGDGHGLFLADQVLPSQSNVGDRIAVGDVNGDLHLDVVTTNRALFGTGTGTFTESSVFPSSEPTYASVAVADTDGDGTAEVFQFGMSTMMLSVYGFAGGAQFVARSKSSHALMANAHLDVLHDFDRDGRPDALIGAPSFVAALAYPDWSSGIAIREFAIGNSLTSFGLGDWNGDGIADLFGGNSALTQAWTNDGHGGFLPGVPLASPIGLFRASAGDVDGDGLADIAGVTSDSMLRAFIGDGTGGFTVGPIVDAGAASGFALGDLDNDGDLDAWVLGTSPSRVVALANDGVGHFSVVAAIPLSVVPVSLATGDLDHDLRADLVIANQSSSFSRILATASGFSPVVSWGVWGTPRDVTLGDIDADGNLDVFVSGSPYSNLFVGNGVGGFSFVSPQISTSAGDGAAIGDVDGDGNADVVVAGWSDFELLRGHGNGTFAVPERFQTAQTASRVALGRLDGDDELDVAVATSGGRVVFDFQRGVHAPLSTYCVAKTSSVGCAPAIAGFGQARASTWDQPFRIRASQVLNKKFGLLFYGISGRSSLPFQGGILCVKLPLKRTAAQNSGGHASGADCSGSFSIEFNGYMASGVDPSLAPGVTVDAQWWYRDPGYSPPNNTGLSDALEFTVLAP